LKKARFEADCNTNNLDSTFVTLETPRAEVETPFARVETVRRDLETGLVRVVFC
jgi:hypothetical protein